MLFALEVASKLGARDVVLVGDSRNVVAQANGAKCRSPDLFTAFAEVTRSFDRVHVRYVRRGQNLAGIALAKLASETEPA